MSPCPRPNPLSVRIHPCPSPAPCGLEPKESFLSRLPALTFQPQDRRCPSHRRVSLPREDEAVFSSEDGATLPLLAHVWLDMGCFLRPRSLGPRRERARELGSESWGAGAGDGSWHLGAGGRRGAGRGTESEGGLGLWGGAGGWSQGGSRSEGGRRRRALGAAGRLGLRGRWRTRVLGAGVDVRGRVALAPPGKDTSAGLFGLEAWRKAHSRRREKHRSRLPRVVWLALH